MTWERNAGGLAPVYEVDMEAIRLDLDGLTALVVAAREGERPALEALLRQSAGLVHALLRARLGDGHLAEEATVDALARIARGLPGLANPAAYGPWVGRIVRHAAADALRGRSRAGGVLPDRPDDSLGPLEALEDREHVERLRRAVARLPVRQREVVLLHFLEDLTYREIARLLGVGLGTVARRMERGLQMLRRGLGGAS